MTTQVVSVVPVLFKQSVVLVLLALEEVLVSLVANSIFVLNPSL